MAVYILSNPSSGNGRAVQVISDLHEQYPKVVFKVFETKKIGDEEKIVTDILKKFDEKYDQFLIIGGDGTLSKVLKFWPRELPFAYLAAGSGNDFAKSLGDLPQESVISAVLLSKKRPINLLVSDQGVAVNSFDLGFAAKTIALSERSKVKYLLKLLGLGRLSYIILGIRALFSSKMVSIQLEIDGQEQILNDLFFFSIANNRYFGGGITIWPESHVTTSNLTVVYAKNRGWFGNVKTLLSLICNNHHKSPNLVVQTGQSVGVRVLENSLAQIDGESFQIHEVAFTCQTRYLYY
ncbi:diacylglycerol/lipid kinase family protein [Streptococcus caprae]|uniref:Diacylglycerol/lipid kinase family protein n=1 Tax=Streptococcus caprae TaxID=1640501 RepID=A0ABV8CVW3_9STRE